MRLELTECRLLAKVASLASSAKYPALRSGVLIGDRGAVASNGLGAVEIGEPLRDEAPAWHVPVVALRAVQRKTQALRLDPEARSAEVIDGNDRARAVVARFGVSPDAPRGNVYPTLDPVREIVERQHRGRTVALTFESHALAKIAEMLAAWAKTLHPHEAVTLTVPITDRPLATAKAKSTPDSRVLFAVAEAEISG